MTSQKEKKTSKTPEQKLKELFDQSTKYSLLNVMRQVFFVSGLIGIKVNKTILGNIFQPFTQNAEQKIPVFFIVTLKPPQDIYSLNKKYNFSLKHTPILYLSKKSEVLDDNQDFDQLLDSWLYDQF